MKYLIVPFIVLLAGCASTEQIKYVPVASTCPTFPIHNYPVLDNELELTVKPEGNYVKLKKDEFLELIKNYKRYKKYYNNLVINVNEFNLKVRKSNEEKVNGESNSESN